MGRPRLPDETRDRIARLIHDSGLDNETTREAYRTRDPRIPNVHLVVDMDKRYRWDLFYAVRGYVALPEGERFKDSHIDTVLRRIVRPL